MKRLVMAAILLGAASTTGGVAYAEDLFSANVAMTTDYRFRGISQTNRDPAIQGGFDFGHDSGFYVGAWASNVSFTEGGTEFDFYLGWGTDLNENVAIDLGYIYYAYPSSNFGPGAKADYWELQGNIAFYGATVGINYADSYTFGSGRFVYLYGQYGFPLGEVASLDLHLGYNGFKDDGLNIFLGTDPDFSDHGKSYLDYSIGVTATLGGLDWSLAYVGSDIDKDDCFPATSPPDGSGTKACSGSGVFTVSKSF